MRLFERMNSEYEQIVFCHDETTALKAIVAIHSTVLGPSLGGTRFYPYANEEDALEDVLRLAKGMTYKSSAAGLDLGGGKAVIIGDPAVVKSKELLTSYARFVDSLTGRYITAEDVGTSLADMDTIHTETPYVTGIAEKDGGSGDPSPVTAWGVFHGIKGVSEYVWGSEDLVNRHVVINGVGKVGSSLARHLVEAGAKVTVADINTDAVNALVNELGVSGTDYKTAHSVECDIYSPCALGKALNDQTIPELKCEIVCGAANNQLNDDTSADKLAQRSIVYTPDFIVNAGGVINIAEELVGYDRTKAYERTAEIQSTTKTVLETAKTLGITTAAAANHVAEARIQEVASKTQSIRSFPKK